MEKTDNHPNKTHYFTVNAQDTVRFLGVELHPVCATYILAREVEYAGRLCLLAYLQPDCEAVGTYLELNHVGAALVGDQVRIEAQILAFENREMECGFEAFVGDKMIAHGKTKQKILTRARLNSLWTK